MPHMVISYAKPVDKKVDIHKLTQGVWDAANESGLFSEGAIKARAIPVESYVTGGTDKPFIHVDAKLFTGRTDEQKQDMVKRIFDRLVELVGEEVSLSVEAIDIDKPNYIKN